MTSQNVITQGITNAQLGIRRLEEGIVLLARLQTALPDPDLLGHVRIGWFNDNLRLDIQPYKLDGHAVAALLVRHAGLVFTRDYNRDIGTIYYETREGNARITVYGHRDPTCEIVRNEETRPVARYELRCPGTAEVTP